MKFKLKNRKLYIPIVSFLINATAKFEDFIAVGWFDNMLSIAFKKIYIEQSELDRILNI